MGKIRLEAERLQPKLLNQIRTTDLLGKYGLRLHDDYPATHDECFNILNIIT